jgi:hypothetical protein
MITIIAKYALTALIIVLVSEVAKRSDKVGALISSLPFVTILAMIWLYVEKQGSQKIGNQAVDPGFETRGIVMVSGLLRTEKGAEDEQEKATQFGVQGAGGAGGGEGA